MKAHTLSRRLPDRLPSRRPTLPVCLAFPSSPLSLRPLRNRSWSRLNWMEASGTWSVRAKTLVTPVVGWRTRPVAVSWTSSRIRTGNGLAW